MSAWQACSVNMTHVVTDSAHSCRGTLKFALTAPVDVYCQCQIDSTAYCYDWHNLCLGCVAVGHRKHRKAYTDLDDLELIRTNTRSFITDESHQVSGLSVGECLSPTLLWDWPKEREEWRASDSSGCWQLMCHSFMMWPTPSSSTPGSNSSYIVIP